MKPKFNGEEAVGSPLRGRRRVIMIPTGYVLELFSRGLLSNEYIKVPEPLGLPKTANAVGIWHDYQYDAFALVVEDASFDVTPAGCQYPSMEVKWHTVRRKIETQRTPSA